MEKITINEILTILNYLNFNYTVNHTNDYSEVKIPSNNDFSDLILLFDCETKEIYSKEYEEID